MRFSEKNTRESKSQKNEWNTVKIFKKINKKKKQGILRRFY